MEAYAWQVGSLLPGSRPEASPGAATNLTSGAVVKVSSPARRAGHRFPLAGAGGRELRAFVSLKMADEETDGAERMDVSPEPPQAPQRPASVSLPPPAPFVLSPRSLPPRLGGCGALPSVALPGKGSPRIEGPPRPRKVSGHLHTFLPARSAESNDCHPFSLNVLRLACLYFEVERNPCCIIRWFAVGAEGRLEKAIFFFFLFPFGRRIADSSR